MKRGEHRSHILRVATELFYKDGIHATGIDAIIAHADVARMTLYKHFPSKESLIEAVLREHIESTRQLLSEIVHQKDLSPEGRLWTLFEQLGEVSLSSQFFGCPFINAVAEYSDADHLVRRIAIEYKQMYRQEIQNIVNQIGVQSPTLLSEQLFLLIEGMLVSAQVEKLPQMHRSATDAAHVLLDHYRARGGNES